MHHTFDHQIPHIFKTFSTLIPCLSFLFLFPFLKHISNWKRHWNCSPEYKGPWSLSAVTRYTSILPHSLTVMKTKVIELSWQWQGTHQRCRTPWQSWKQRYLTSLGSDKVQINAASRPDSNEDKGTWPLSAVTRHTTTLPHAMTVMKTKVLDLSWQWLGTHQHCRTPWQSWRQMCLTSLGSD